MYVIRQIPSTQGISVLPPICGYRSEINDTNESHPCGQIVY
jgi:hypothetical protein